MKLHTFHAFPVSIQSIIILVEGTVVVLVFVVKAIVERGAAAVGQVADVTGDGGEAGFVSSRMSSAMHAAARMTIMARAQKKLCV